MSDQDSSNPSEENFRSMVNRAVDAKVLYYLNRIARGHSKSEDLVKSILKREDYFTDADFSKS